MKKPLWIRKLLPALAVLLLLAALWFVFTRTGPLAPIQVTVGQVDEGSVLPQRFGIGTVEAQRSWALAPTATARLRSLAVDVGDRVLAGQVLAEMDLVDFDERLRALDASVARAASQQQAASALAVDAAARLALARANHQRNLDLARQQFISAGALESREQELRSAQAALAVAESNIQTSQLDAQRLAAERAGLKKQRERLRLRAPADSVVVAREGEAGATVVAGQSVFKLVDPASLWLRVRIDQGQSAGLAVGTPAQVVLRSQPQQTHAGRIARLEWLADSVTEERLVLVAFDAMPAAMSIGEMAEVTLLLPASPSGLRVPSASVVSWQGRSGVWRLQQGQAHFVPVQVLARGADGQVLLQAANNAKPLAKGDSVVVHSQRALAPDARIRTVTGLVPGAAQP
jgi:HlyD family secretion protein